MGLSHVMKVYTRGMLGNFTQRNLGTIPHARPGWIGFNRSIFWKRTFQDTVLENTEFPPTKLCESSLLFFLYPFLIPSPLLLESKNTLTDS